ncbi:MAG: tetratricopeptide repeat protein [Desulfuromonadaceae bacterium]
MNPTRPVNRPLLIGLWLLLLLTAAIRPCLGSPMELNNEAVVLLNRQAPLAALPKLLAADQALPDNPVIRKNLAECYFQLGVDQLQTGNYEQAVENFFQGKSYGKEDPRFWVYSGIALRKAGHSGAAETEFNEALTLADDNPVILYLLGELYYATGELYRARQVLEDAAAAAPAEERIQALLEKVKRELPVEEGMSRAQGGNFSVSCDGQLSAELAERILAVLEEAYNELGSEFDYYPQVQIPVLIYSPGDYTDLTDAPSWSAGVYDGKIRLPIAGLGRLSAPFKAALYHEYSHVLVHFLARNRAPVWLNEGLAEIAGRRWFVPPHSRQPLSVLDWSRLNHSFQDLTDTQIRGAYEQSYSFVSYLIDRYGRHLLNDLLIAAGRTTDFASAVKEVYGVYQLNLEELRQEWQRQAVHDGQLH